MLNSNVPKPAFRAYEILHNLGEELLPVKGKHETVDVWIIKKQKIINIVITTRALPRHPIKTESVKIQLKNNNKIKTCFIQKIDDSHANPRKSWAEMGKPSGLSHAQVSSLEVTSAMVKEPHLAKQEKNWLVVEAALPPQGIAYITLEFE